MVDPQFTSLLRDQYGFVFEEDLIQEITKVSTARSIRDGFTLIDVGQKVDFIPLILEGTLKVIREDKEGKEMLLYYLEKGDTCAMSFSCCMGSRKSKVRAIADEETMILAIPLEYIDQWITKFPSWKSFVFDTFNVRIDELIETVDSIAFMKLDERLKKYLVDKAKVFGKTDLTATHQEIAEDLNTSRVVVSRLLKQLEKRGEIKLGRNKVEVLEF